jgi:HD-like signal output (HDOD) protein
LREAIQDPRILDLVGEVDSIPSIPWLYSEIVSAIQAGRLLSEIGDLVSQDVGMAAKLLHAL